MAYFSIGDIVTVRNDLVIDKIYKSKDGVMEIFTDKMERFLGKKMEITGVTDSGKYLLEGVIFLFVDEMFEEYYEYDEDDYEGDYYYEENDYEAKKPSKKSYHELEYGANTLGKEGIKLINELEKVNIENLINKVIDNKEYIENPNVFEEIIVKYNLL